MEAYRYPFYGAQFHPEVSSYYTSQDYATYNLYFAEFFADEASMNNNGFESESQKIASLIGNYLKLTDSGSKVYVF